MAIPDEEMSVMKKNATEFAHEVINEAASQITNNLLKSMNKSRESRGLPILDNELHEALVQTGTQIFKDTFAAAYQVGLQEYTRRLVLTNELSKIVAKVGITEDMMKQAIERFRTQQ